MAHNAGFAVLVIVEDGVIGDAILLAQALLQQLVGQHAQTLPLFKFELQGLLTTLLRNLSQCRLQVKPQNMFTHQSNHNSQLSTVHCQLSIVNSGVGILLFGFSLAPKVISSCAFWVTLWRPVISLLLVLS